MKKFNTQQGSIRRFYMLCLLAMMVVVAGCSSIRLAYNNSDTLMYWWIDSYVDLDSEQSDWVKQDIDQLLSWHRRTQLKDYAQLLLRAQSRLGGKVSQEDLHADYRDVMDRVELLAFKALPDLADLARSVRPEQIASIEKKFRSNNEKYLKESINDDQEGLQKKRFKKTMKQLETWFGDFSGEQTAALRKVSDARPLDNRIWLAERVLRQQQVLHVLRKIEKEKLGKQETMSLIHNLLTGIFARADAPERKVFFDASLDGSTKVVLTAIQIATPAQKAHARARIQGWINDFNSLASAS